MKGSLGMSILSIYIVTNYRPQHTGFHASLKSRSSIPFAMTAKHETTSDMDKDQVQPKTKHRIIENTLDGIIPVYSNT